MSENENSKSGSAGRLLAVMFEKIRLMRHAEPKALISRIDNFISNPANGIKQDKRFKSSTRGNMLRELAADTMTWNVFCRALRVLNYPKFDFVIRIKHINGKVTEHSIPVDMGEFSLYGDGEDVTKDNVDDVLKMLKESDESIHKNDEE